MKIDDPKLVDLVSGIVLEGFQPHFDELPPAAANPLWARAAKLGSKLWLDTGDIEAIEQNWTAEFSALTTNNTLLNNEVQKGTYDDLVKKSVGILRREFPDLDDRSLVRELAFILNAYHGLRLVEKFDAFVSVEEHTDLAHDVDAAVQYGVRYHAICPERFIVKVPFTGEGLIAARELGERGVPINLTLGFSARQNVIIAGYAKPAFCNVFLGRLNQVVSSNGLGDGALVGERATVASQQRLREYGYANRQIAASIRNGEQVRDLVGIDVLTIPPKAAAGFVALGLPPGDLACHANTEYQPTFADGVDPEASGINLLWHVPLGIEKAVAEVASRKHTTGPELLADLEVNGLGGALPAWSEADVAKATQDGKIPFFADWAERIASGAIGLDAVMNLSGLCSFASDQKAMDERISGLF
jgi:transaldolase